MEAGKRLICLAAIVLLPLSVALASCVAPIGEQNQSKPLTLELTRLPDQQIAAAYRIAEPIQALHFPSELGGYRVESWRPKGDDLRWVIEGDGERVERVDGRPFEAVTFIIPIDYRELPKSYAPFSPFSEGSTLIHSGQFQACLAAPCEDPVPLPIAIEAKGATIGLEGRRTLIRDQFVSQDDGTNIFVGTLEPVEADGFVAVIDPGLPPDLRRNLDRSLPQAMEYFASVYGFLSFTPELYVSIDDEPEKHGKISTQGGTLPNQVFMHFDGENARERLATEDPLWLEWFFAHEAAHLFQQDKAGGKAGDDVAAWIHEGGADAMAALAMKRRGMTERSYAQKRLEEAQTACALGLATSPLNKATAEGKFDLHYQCGLVIWLALDHDLRRNGDADAGLHDLNRAFFTAVRNGQPWNEPIFLQTAGQEGVSQWLLTHITRLNDVRYATSAVAELGQLAKMSLLSDE
ncbi:hypothetical protein [Qipengyuania qiaonensis]|uniref:Peptidase M61 catalytic domain-containing protein n=1 Tax=Qipengyuania qiaonensis TaxID=2867240 RepID=A0ABS7J6V3_9SPHN|nr:hypothetical protein [Qipengyuania qiaonensis]MBX7483038.1 hypothetical protein [Qipengyuania qiaonensis]